MDDTETGAGLAALEERVNGVLGPFSISHGLEGIKKRRAALEAHMHETESGGYVQVLYIGAVADAPGQAPGPRAVLRSFGRKVLSLFARRA